MSRIFPGSPPEDDSTEIGTVDDWFGLLNSDERDVMFVVGSSDSNTIISGGPVGYPRSCVLVGTDDPETLRANANPPQTMKRLVKDGRSVINGGIASFRRGQERVRETRSRAAVPTGSSWRFRRRSGLAT